MAAGRTQLSPTAMFKRHFPLIAYHFSLIISLLLLAACSGRLRERMHDELLRAREMNKGYVPFTTDSVMKQVVAYYDRHGTPNERMEAHYLLGCAYRDMGETPRAVDCYLDAAACADTTASDCDFWMMASVYGQMATLYHRQLLFSYEIDAHRQASHYNLLSGDTLSSLYEQKMVAGISILQNRKDSVEAILQNTINLYNELGYQQEAVQTTTMLMSLYSEKPERLPDLKRLIDIYEERNTLLSVNSDLPPAKRLFYCYKARYFEGINQLDSAEYYYRKMYYCNMPLTSRNSMYKGLLSVFYKRSQADSIDKYAQLYCAVNDSSIAIKDQELTAQLAASYNYSHYQKQALVNEREATKAKETLIGVILLSCVIISIASLLWMRYKRIQNEKHKQLLRTQKKKQQEIERLESEFKDITEQYNKNKQAMLLLEESYKMTVASVQHRLENAQEVISELNGKYERSIALFKDETDALKKKLSEMNSQKSISELIDDGECFANSSIVLRVRELVEKQRVHILKRDWEELSAAFATYYPNLVKDLYDINNVTTQEIQTAFLVVLSIRTDDIARLLQVSGQRITNIKSELNLALFGTKSARTLFDNIKSRYGICLLEK